MDPRTAYGLPRSAGSSATFNAQAPSKAPSSNGGPGQMTRAQRFEDEKRRIVESCFSKFDESGQLAESYITHIRVTEDSSHPQTPHPPDSPSANKERLVIVAVKNTGRVRVHKARENANLTFSIGKTWNLEDLSVVQSWALYTPRSQEEARYQDWAGETGFTVTMIKPYFWQANTAKEKEFFIASLVKIYRRYTQGKVPELVGFPQRDVDQILGPQSRSASGTSPLGAPQIPPFSPGRPRMPSQEQSISSPSPTLPIETPSRNRPLTAESNDRPFYTQKIPTSLSETPPPATMPLNTPPVPGRMGSREQLRPNKITPQSSASNSIPVRDRTPDSFGSRIQASTSSPDRRSPSRTRNGPDSRDAIRGANSLGLVNRSNASQKEEEPGSVKTAPQNGLAAPRRPSNASQDSLFDSALPERRRPPFANSLSNDSQTSMRNNGNRPVGRVPPASASTDSLVKGKMERMPGGFVPSPAPSREIEKEGLLPPPLSTKPKVDAPAIASIPTSTAQPIPRELKDEPMPASAEESFPAEKKTELSQEDELDAARPGLGRMFGNKQKTTKELFKSAATAALASGAFVPRAGGAGARLRAVAATDTDVVGKEPDGISGVVPAPHLNRTGTQESVALETPKDDSSIQVTPVSVQAPPSDALPKDIVPQVTVSSPLSPQKITEPPPRILDQAAEAAVLAAQKKAKQAEEEAARRKKRRSAAQLKYLSRLGIDGSLLENQGLDFEAVLDEVGWGNSTYHSKGVEGLEGDIRREIGRVEAGSWLGHLEQKDDRVEAIENLLDKTIAEIDELDGLLTLYSVELSSLNDDIAFIEAQSQGLQVQTANQKLLQLELQNLVSTISINAKDLEPLRRPMPANSQGLDAIEKSLLLLYKAMVTIDPTIRQNSNGVGNQNALMANTELSSMVALQEKSDQYLSECAMFLKRFTQHMDLTFGAAVMSARDVAARQKGNTGAKLSTEPYDAARYSLWPYGPLMLFAKEVDKTSWDGLLKSYQARTKPLYQDEFSNNIYVWKKLARKSTGEEQELLFTFNRDVEAENLTATARRITVKRSQTLARGLRVASTEKEKDRANDPQVASLWPFEVFASALDEISPFIAVEQNFIVELFHATGTENMDFADAVLVAPPEARRPGQIYGRKAFEPDREMARRVAGAMDEIFSSFASDLQSLIEWAIKMDPLQGIGIMHALSRTQLQFEDTNQEFLTATLNTITQRLVSLWNRFVDDQIRAIEDTKVKIKKRKGVINFMKTFPTFSAAIENQLPSAADEGPQASETRALIDQAYERIIKAMFESLRVIAKEGPSVIGGLAGVSALQAAREDPEDKEALNYHILLIENSNHYLEEVESHGDGVLEDGKRMAKEEFDDHLGLYVEAVIRRPLGKAIDFLDTLSLAQQALPATLPPSALSTRTQTSRSNFKKVLAAHDVKEMRRGVEALRKRVEKHFMEADEQNLSQELVRKVLGACEEKYKSISERIAAVAVDVYEGSDGAEGLGRADEIGRWFRGSR